jgi:hypothetical protein
VPEFKLFKEVPENISLIHAQADSRFRLEAFKRWMMNWASVGVRN